MGEQVVISLINSKTRFDDFIDLDHEMEQFLAVNSIVAAKDLLIRQH